jgi:ABC-type transport system substrate-binding protein
VLVVGLRAEPRTLNPVASLDLGSRELIRLLSADLVHVDRGSLEPVPELASNWTISKDGREFTLYLRQGLRFSDGVPFDADDVVFTFRVHLDERVHSPQREMLTVGGKPISVRKIDTYTVAFDLAEPYSSAERLFDGIAMLPKHLLEKAYSAGTLGEAWNLATQPSEIAGLGPFRVREYQPGQPADRVGTQSALLEDRQPTQAAALPGPDRVCVYGQRRRAGAAVSIRRNPPHHRFERRQFCRAAAGAIRAPAAFGGRRARPRV